MRSKFIIFFLCMLGLFFYGFSTEDSDSSEPGAFEFDQFLISHLPGGYFYPFIIENYVPDATFLIEENNGFSLMDNPRVYFEGDSFSSVRLPYGQDKMAMYIVLPGSGAGIDDVIESFDSVSCEARKTAICRSNCMI